MEAKRTLVKSPPELWAELSDAAALAHHLGEFGEIRITRTEPETVVEWEGDRAWGSVRLEPSGWGTRVTFVAEPVTAAPADAVTDDEVRTGDDAVERESGPPAAPEHAATEPGRDAERMEEPAAGAEPAVEPRGSAEP